MSDDRPAVFCRNGYSHMDTESQGYCICGPTDSTDKPEAAERNTQPGIEE